MEGGKDGRMEEGKTERQWLVISDQFLVVSKEEWTRAWRISYFS